MFLSPSYRTVLLTGTILRSVKPLLRCDLFGNQKKTLMCKCILKKVRPTYQVLGVFFVELNTICICMYICVTTLNPLIFFLLAFMLLQQILEALHNISAGRLC